MTPPAQPQPRITVARTAVAVLAGCLTYYVVLAVVALAQGKTLVYPLRAIVAIFSGNHALPGYGRAFDVGVPTAVVTGVIWLLLLSAACAGTFAFLVRRRRLTALVLGVAAVAWSLLWLGIALLVFDNGGTAAIRRAVSSFQGLHELGAGAFAAAHVAFGVAVALAFAWPLSRQQSEAPVDDRMRRTAPATQAHVRPGSPSPSAYGRSDR